MIRVSALSEREKEMFEHARTEFANSTFPRHLLGIPIRYFESMHPDEEE